MSGKPWARPHDDGRRVTCEKCGERFGPLGPGRQLCAKHRIEWSHASAVDPLLTLDTWLVGPQREETR